jgi:hypothetical protein
MKPCLYNSIEGSEAMSHDERVDVIDFIINVLKEHEKTLDAQVAKLDEILASERTARPSRGEEKGRSPRVKVALDKWSEFQEKCTKPQILAFSVSAERLEVAALKGDTLFVYREEIPELSMTVEKEGGRIVTKGGDFSDLFDSLSLIAGSLRCGMPISHRRVDFRLPDGNVVQKIIFEVDGEIAKSWLSKQLGVEKASIIFGSVEI